ncbi:MAG: hypothetical protein AAF960_06985 [Bacteroidota bacterium]
MEKVTGIGSSCQITNNPFLERIDLPNNLVVNGALQILSNASLTSISGVNNSTNFGSISIFDNERLSSLTAFAQLQVTEGVSIVKSPLLKEITNFGALTVSQQLVQIANNDGLERVVFPKLAATALLSIRENVMLMEVTIDANLTVADRLQVTQNPNLSDCCIFKNLFDDNPLNGEARGEIIIAENTVVCESVETIVSSCDDTGATGCEVLRIESNKTFIEFL